MKALHKFIGISAFAVLAAGAVSCVEDEALEIQKPYTYDEQYFENVREYKARHHCLSYAFYAAYAPLEGVEGYKDPASWGERIRGLPDSLDICNLWMGAPSKDPNESNYMPIAYEDMRYVQEHLGTRFVLHADATASVREVGDQTFDFTSNTDSVVVEYGKALVQYIVDHDIDGIDIDFEPNWSTWTRYIGLLTETIGQYFGPMGTMPEKLLIIDFYTAGYSLSSAYDKYVNYYVIQAYGASSDNALQNSWYGQISSWCDPGKVIVCETFGDYYANGGVAFTDKNGNSMYSLEGMARWNPTQGEKGGFGAYYMDRDYYSSTGIPYYNFRRCIQIANPAVY